MTVKKNSIEQTPAFKQIRAWKVGVLGVVTLGVYFIIWLLMRRRELPTPKPRFSHGGWIFGMAFILVAATLSLYLTAIIGVSDSTTAAYMIVYGLSALTLVFTVGIALWMFQIITGINRALRLNLQPALIFLLGLFCGPLLIVYEQLAINRLQPYSKATSTQLMQQFGWLALVGLTLGVAFNVFYALTTPIDVTIDQVRREHAEARKDIERIFQLAKEYTDCTDKLARDYPEGSATPGEDYTAYSAAYDKCQAIYEQIGK